MESNNETAQRTTAGESNCLLLFGKKTNVKAATARRCSPTQGEASPHRPPSQEESYCSRYNEMIQITIILEKAFIL